MEGSGGKIQVEAASEVGVVEGGHHGRPCSWLAIAIIAGAFGVGALALIIGRWWLVWVAVSSFVLGVVVALAVDIFADVVLDPIHGEWAEVHISPVRKIIRWDAPDHLSSPSVYRSSDDHGFP